MTHEEEINLALQIIQDNPRHDLEAGRDWVRKQRRIVDIQDGPQSIKLNYPVMMS